MVGLGTGGRTPHLALLLLFCVFYAEDGSPCCGIVVDLQVGWDFEVELSCTRHVSESLDHLVLESNAPNGPVTVTVLFGMTLQFVGSLLTFGSPIISSTPGGIEMGVRPSLDGLHVVEVNVRRVWRAGTRNEGTVVAEGEDATAFSKALLLHGANIVSCLSERSILGFATPVAEAGLEAPKMFWHGCIRQSDCWGGPRFKVSLGESVALGHSGGSVRATSSRRLQVPKVINSN